MILSHTSEYALRAVLHLARQPDDQLARVADVAAALDIPRNYLSKILHLLAHAGILASTRGKMGGFRLAVEPREITLLDIVREFEDVNERRQCLLGRAVCSDRSPCLAHGKWKATSEAVTAFFRDTTILDLLRETLASVDAA